MSDVASRLWFTYRKNFPAIGEYPHGQHMTIQACSLRRELDSRLHTPDVCLFVVLVMAACPTQVAEGPPWCGSVGPDPGLLTLLWAGKSWLLLGPKIRILSLNRQLDIWNRMEHEWCVTSAPRVAPWRRSVVRVGVVRAVVAPEASCCGARVFGSRCPVSALFFF